MSKILDRNQAGREFYSRNMSYHNTIESIRTFQCVKGREIVGTIFVFDKDEGFDRIIGEFSNVQRMDVGKSYAPEIKKPALLVLSKAEVSRIKNRTTNV